MLEPSGNEGCGISSRLFCSTSDSSAEEKVVCSSQAGVDGVGGVQAVPGDA